jgi:small subunit ribosomal protein S7
MRGKRAKKRTILPDAEYGDLKITKFINYTMQDGKKAIAAALVYEALEEASKSLKQKPVDIFNKAIDNVKPKIEVRSRRVGGANYQVPVPVKTDRQESLAMRWILESARNARKNSSFSKTLAQEFINAFNKEGIAVRKKEETHKMADANKAFAHFSW